MLSATRAFLSAAEKDAAVLREAAAALSSQEPGPAAWIALTFGTLVERGSAAELTGPAVLEHLRSWLPKLPAPAKEGGPSPEPSPGQKRLLAQFQFYCQSVVTHLARLPALRAAMGREEPLVRRLDELSIFTMGAWWVHEALLKTSGTLIVLHPPSGTGLRLTVTNVSNGFHLFSLLQTAVGTRIPGGRAPNETVAWVARGQSSEKVTDDAWWHYGNPASPKPDALSSIRGEGLVRDLTRVEGEPVILLWPMILKSRSWDGAFLGPHLEAMPADATVERMLTPDESSAWLKKLGITRQRKWWWPF